MSKQLLDDQAAAALLRGLLAGDLNVKEARRKWPNGPTSEPSASTYLDYFEQGLDGKGTRDPQVDRIVANLANSLDSGGNSKWHDKSESWQVGSAHVDETRSADQVFRRMVASYLAFERTRLEMALAAHVLSFPEADKEAGKLSGAMSYLFGTDDLEDDERRVLKAPTGEILRADLSNMHWRIECVGVLAWALGFLPELPAASERFNYETIRAAAISTPEDAKTKEKSARLRPTSDLLLARASWKVERLASENAARKAPNNTGLQLTRSRAVERYRALIWLTNSYYPSMEQTSAEAQ
jgi:Domain of unknown function (DUF4272)